MITMFLAMALSAPAEAQTSNAALPSWRDGPTKQAIVEFVERTTKPGSPDFIAPADRIAVFDNDGTLWSEQPLYFQFLFALDRVRALAPQHPEWKTTEPFKWVLDNDIKSLEASGEKGLLPILAATHAGMTTEEFTAIVRDWMADARHPVTKRRYDAMVFKPMQELMQYLRANGYGTWIVSGGGQEFLRAWCEAAYGIPPQQVIGSYAGLKYQAGDRPSILKTEQPELVDDHAGKPVGIQRFLGRRPVMAFGNSDGDFEMLEWTTTGPGPRFGALVHHTDAEREFAYDRKSHVGQLARGLDEAPKRKWVLIDMKRDWETIYPDSN
ncbi:haloacid dehalogenase-like hydrolase [Lysobacter sp. A6]|uniref:phosphoserine phosphatase n=1 Tax=Noviluteimonas lactosilytica TaxID=2888523 RepID=A0ABS8JD66_9GAMM|nr:HAD family hydrolase [Lysobacter lactosilyticus]MCC8361534.1 haloacid dehalogenase-like hydrolase [Lysobacter lactosilyticus]